MYQLQVNLFPEAPALVEPTAAFQQRFAAFQEGPSGTFSFPDEAQQREAAAFLSQRNVGFERTYRFEVPPTEVARHPAFFLGLATPEGLFRSQRVSAAKLNDVEIALDYRTHRIVLHPRVRDVLEPLLSHVRWDVAEGTRGGEYAVLQAQAELPEPLFMPKPLDVLPSEDPSGTASVRGDGRVVISPRAIDALRGPGLALSHQVRAGMQVIRWGPRLVASGAVCHALVSANVRGVWLFPLLTEADSFVG